MFNRFNKDYYEENGALIDKDTGLLLEYPVEEHPLLKKYKYTKKIYLSNLEFIPLPIAFKNYGNTLNYFKIIFEEFPVGLKYINSRLPKGKFYENSLTWQIGKILPKEEIMGELFFKPYDAIFSPFTFKYEIKYNYG